tara:strand:- start:1059 stop:1223 length:165 start_codon:yes stop_codon:yes gene_type:complete
VNKKMPNNSRTREALIVKEKMPNKFIAREAPKIDNSFIPYHLDNFRVYYGDYQI